MNPAAVRLFLTLLWLIPGVGLLIHDLATGRAIIVQLRWWRVPLWAPFLVFAGFDFLRWLWAVRSRPRAPRRREPEGEPDPAFRFDDPPKPAGDDTNR
jgi:hypothetical protein